MNGTMTNIGGGLAESIARSQADAHGEAEEFDAAYDGPPTPEAAFAARVRRECPEGMQVNWHGTVGGTVYAGTSAKALPSRYYAACITTNANFREFTADTLAELAGKVIEYGRLQQTERGE